VPVTGACDFCKAENVEVERDHRIPKARGGTNAQANLHLLCLVCHRRKSALEFPMGFFPGSIDRNHAEWHRIAFPEPLTLETAIYVTEWADGPEAVRPYLIWRLLLVLRCREAALQSWPGRRWLIKANFPKPGLAA
jgi:hypothetical protein